MLFQPDPVIRIIQEQARNAPSYAVSYQIVTTIIDVGILTIFLGIISFVRFWLGPDRREKAGRFFQHLFATFLISGVIYLIYWIVWYFKRDAIDTPFRMIIFPSGFPFLFGVWELIKAMAYSMRASTNELVSEAVTSGLGTICGALITMSIYFYTRALLSV
jgi:hypothetical protein